MNDSRLYASLSSGLLARKGAAKPAMRPQAYGSLEDLGWNDMGYDPVTEQPTAAPVPEHVPSPITALTPAPRTGEIDPEAFYGEEEEGESEATSGPARPGGARPAQASEEDYSVVAQQRAILERFDGSEESDDGNGGASEPGIPAKKAQAGRAEVVPLPKRAAPKGGRKAAFTLRLDPDRHLRLRLACAVTGRSAQQIVTSALDAALTDIPEIEALASRVPAKAGSAGAKRN
ncbi:hypothetical protein [Sphingosinicella sp. CPCC 101087]|uniref:hypothetical protein n=1 Tax=Sphingosinicella sp. CPCC 101087 TaxID=2497754 RepID=UPI00101DBB94|nr:hypothetical protein [Sphingosinicella sp. CPCC 101087]